MPKNGGATKNDAGPLETLKSVYEFMTRNGLDAVEIVEDGAQVKLVRRRPVQVPVPVPVPAGGGSPAGPAAAPAAAPALPAGQAVKSPMMGIFYRAASPSSPPFVREGEAVKPGQVLCMIEAMKVFNEIKAEFPCTVLKTLVENGKPVKSGQDLFLIQR